MYKKIFPFLAIFFLYGCGTTKITMENTDTNIPASDFFSYKAKLEGMQAIPAIGGKLIKVDGCILFEDELGTVVTPIFPYQTTQYDKFNDRISIAGDWINLGQSFSTSGYIVDKNHKAKYVTRGRDACLKDKVVFLGAGVSIVK